MLLQQMNNTYRDWVLLGTLLGLKKKEKPRMNNELTKCYFLKKENVQNNHNINDTNKWCNDR